MRKTPLGDNAWTVVRLLPPPLHLVEGAAPPKLLAAFNLPRGFLPLQLRGGRRVLWCKQPQRPPHLPPAGLCPIKRKLVALMSVMRIAAAQMPAALSLLHMMLRSGLGALRL